jgi:hypothetical protein
MLRKPDDWRRLERIGFLWLLFRPRMVAPSYAFPGAGGGSTTSNGFAPDG